MRIPDFPLDEVLDLLRFYPSGITAAQVVHQFGYSPADWEFYAYRQKVADRLDMLRAYGRASREHKEDHRVYWRAVQ